MPRMEDNCAFGDTLYDVVYAGKVMATLRSNPDTCVLEHMIQGWFDEGNDAVPGACVFVGERVKTPSNEPVHKQWERVIRHPVNLNIRLASRFSEAGKSVYPHIIQK